MITPRDRGLKTSYIMKPRAAVWECETCGHKVITEDAKRPEDHNYCGMCGRMIIGWGHYKPEKTTPNYATVMKGYISLQEQHEGIMRIVRDLLKEIGESEVDDNVLFLACELNKVCGGFPMEEDMK